jgi:polar amino acid transport system substrate-binding protein
MEHKHLEAKPKSCLLLFFIIYYFSTPTFGTELTVWTTNYPPFSMHEDGEVIGLCTDIIKNLLNVPNTSYVFKEVTVERGMLMSTFEKNNLFYPITLNTKKKTDVLYIGPLYKEKLALISKNKLDLSGPFDEKLKTHKIGALQGSAIIPFLEKKGFTVQTSISENSNSLKLKLDRIDVWATSTLVAAYYAYINNLSYASIIPLGEENSLYLAFNKNSDAEFLLNVQKKFDASKADGSLDKIINTFSKQLEIFINNSQQAPAPKPIPAKP